MSESNTLNQSGMRIDKWLWAARFFKTRSLAKDALNAGKIQSAGQRLKPKRLVHIGEEISITINQVQKTVVIKGLNEQRRPFSEAQHLYEETQASIKERERIKNLHKQAGHATMNPGRRPNKKERRDRLSIKKNFS